MKIIINCSDIILYENGRELGKSAFKNHIHYGPGSVFKMIFNFERDNVIFLHKKNEIHEESLKKCKIFTPAFSFFTKGEEIEVINVEYD